MFGFFGFSTGGNRRQPAADVKCYSMTKVEKASFLYFMSSFAEMRFLIKKSLNRPKKIF
jgi:hypothetical protein